MKRFLFTMIALLSLTLVMGCTGQEVTVSFEENGGNPITDISVLQQNTLKELSGVREGYTFEGWYEDIELSQPFDFDTIIIRNFTLYAKWSINSYTVTFIAEEGGTDELVSGDYGSTIEFPENPVKTGYNFMGWFKDELQTDAFTSNRIPGEDITVYAGWTEKELLVNYYIDSETTPTYSEYVLYGEAAENPPALPVVTGMDSAWSEDLTSVTEDLEVYVEYTKKVFTITFKDYEDNVYSTLTKEYGDTITLPTEPERTGYDFIGYYSEVLERNVDFSNYTVTEDLVVTDSFQIKTFSVKFFGGEESALLGTVVYVSYGSSAQAPTEGLDRLGYTFKAWDIEFDNVTSDLNIYAQYTINQYDATFDANGGIYVDSSDSLVLTQDYNSNVTVSEVPTREDYVFLGWYTDLTYETEVYFGTGIPLAVDGLTVYAKWFDLSTTSYTVSGTYYFEEEGIAADELSTDGLFTQINSEVYTPYTYVAYNSDMSPVRDIEGYEFYKYVYNGVDCFDETQLITIKQDETVDVYYRKVILTVTFAFDAEPTTERTNYYVYYNDLLSNVPNAATLTEFDFIAYYSADLDSNVDFTTYTITEDLFVVNNYTYKTFEVRFFGGDDGIQLGDTQTVNYGFSAVAPSEGLERDVYTFNSWDIEFDNVTGDLNVYAQYTLNQYDAVFNANNGAYADSTTQITLTQDYNTLVTVPEVPTRAGYSFVGWYTDLTYETEVYFATGYSMPKDGLTVYAKWFDLSNTSYTVSGTYFFEEEGIALDELSTDGIYTQTSSEVYLPFTDVLYNSDMNPVRDIEGYDFYKFVYEGVEYFDESILLNILEDETVNVYYRRTIQTVTFTDSEDNTITNYVYYNDLVTNVATAAIVTGYDFVGYYSESLVRYIDFTTYTVTEDLNITYNYQIQTFEVSFYGGQSNALLGTVQTIDYGSSAEAPTTGLDRENYTFTAWDIEFDNITSDLTVTAVYTINQYDAVFNANSGVYLDASSLKTVTQDFNTLVTVPEVPTKDGFIFAGWYTDLSYETEVYFASGVTLPKDGFTVYAKWLELVATTYTVSGTYYFEEVGISVDELSTDDIYTQTGSEAYTPFINVLYDTDMSAVRDIEGYEFYKYVYNGVEYFDSSALLTITADETVDVYYRRIVLTVTFSEQLSGSNVSTKYYVYYNDSLVNVPSPTAVTDMTVAWERQNFDNVKTNLSVVAIQYDNSLQTVSFISNGTIIYMTTNESVLGAAIDPHAVVITADSPLWAIQQDGYRFLGWFIVGTDTEVTLADLYFDDTYFSSANVTTVEARWLELGVLNEATDVTVIADAGNQTITIDFTVLPTDGIYPTDFTFILNGQVIQSADVASDLLMNYITRTGDEFTLTVSETDAYYDFFKENLMAADDDYESLIPGTHTLQIISVGDDITVTSSDTSDVFQYSIDSIYAGIPESSTIKDYYIIEDFGSGTLRYIFYSNLTYQFEGLTFSIDEGSNHITANGNKLSTTDLAGEFTFTITDAMGSRTYEGLVIKDIRQFDIGTSYQNYLTQVNATTDDDAFLEETVGASYNVGASNAFYLDVLLRDNNGAKISLEDVYIDYEFYLNGSATALDATALDNYVTVVGNELYFTTLAVGNEFRVVIEPKYEATLMDMEAIEFNILVNDGYNAFTNSDLKALYSDLNVNYINIHRDIEAEFSANQVYDDGSPINEYARPTNNYNNIGNVYYRINGNTDDDQITLEGNFMTIDGSNLEYINPDKEGFGNIIYAQGFDIVSTQIGIFYYNVYQTEIENNNTFTMNNLKVIGNTTTPSVNYGGTEEEIYNQERLMSKNSGGMLGVIVRNGKASLNNLVIGYTVIGVTTNAYGENSNEEVLTIDLDYVSIYDSWANSIYLHGGSGLSINNSDIASSGGAAIHFEDTHSGSELYDNPQLILGDSNEINNWISGQESWFKAYAMSSIALALKSNINSSISALEKTVIQMRENEVTGLETEMMNLIFLSLPMSSAVTISNPDDSTSVITASEVMFDITDDAFNTVITRDWNFTEQLFPIDATTSIIDPRIAGGQYGFALGSLSDTYAFLTMIATIQGTYEAMTGSSMSSADAGNLAAIAGFYNLNATEAIQVAGGMQSGYTIHQSVIAIKGTLNYAQPQYIEVVAPLSLTGAAGNATILIEMFNTED